MTIKERIELARLGYSKAEIQELAAEEKAAIEAAPVDQAPDAPEAAAAAAPSTTASELMNAITSLTNALHASNIAASRQPDQAPVTVEDVLADILK